MKERRCSCGSYDLQKMYEFTNKPDSPLVVCPRGYLRVSRKIKTVVYYCNHCHDTVIITKQKDACKKCKKVNCEFNIR